MNRKVHSSTLLKTICLMSILQLGFANPDLPWEKGGNGIHEPKVNCVTPHPQNPAIVFAGTSQAVYKSTNHGQDFHAVLQIPGSASGINFLYIYAQTPNEVYAATDSGLYLSSDEGETWQNIFYANNPDNKRCLTVLKYGQEIYLGTLGGLYTQFTPDGFWIKDTNELATSPIFHLYSNDQDLYLATDRDAYRVSWEEGRTDKVFTLLTLSGGEETFDEEAQEEPQSVSKIKAIVSVSDSILYLATIQGVFVTKDAGGSWQRISMNGLPLNKITSMVVLNDDQLIAGTAQGAFVYNDRWQPLYKGMETIEVSYLAQNAGTIYGATDHGLFFMPLQKTLAALNSTNPTNPINSINSTNPNEPTIQEVQQLAIHYAEVDPDKITRWRDLARKKALLPTLSVGLDRSATELLHWDTGPNPDVLSKGREFMDWDLTVSWDLSDIVWSTDQTTIDSRSKLMVELRQDVLDQVTRLYFERRRVQMELAQGSAEPQMHIEKEMRVEELTALIDAFTGGQFSHGKNKEKEE